VQCNGVQARLAARLTISYNWHPARIHVRFTWLPTFLLSTFCGFHWSYPLLALNTYTQFCLQLGRRSFFQVMTDLLWIWLCVVYQLCSWLRVSIREILLPQETWLEFEPVLLIAIEWLVHHFGSTSTLPEAQEISWFVSMLNSTCCHDRIWYSCVPGILSQWELQLQLPHQRQVEVLVSLDSAELLSGFNQIFSH